MLCLTSCRSGQDWPRILAVPIVVFASNVARYRAESGHIRADSTCRDTLSAPAFQPGSMTTYLILLKLRCRGQTFYPAPGIRLSNKLSS
jgi:hypothetical protein